VDVPFETGLDMLRPPSTTGAARPWRPPGLEAEMPDAGSAPAPPVEPSAPPALRFAEDELARAMAAAALETRRTLLAAWRAEEARRLSAEVARVAAALEAEAARVARDRTGTRKALVAILETALRRLVPVLLERLEAAHLRRLLEDWCARLLPEETVRVRVRPTVRESLAAAFDGRGGEGLPRFEFVADPALPPGGVTLERGDGRIHHRPDALVEELVAALRTIVDGPSSPEERDGRREEEP